MTIPLFRMERPEPGSDDYYTPPWIFDALNLKFDLDVAAPPGGVSWLPARAFYTLADDGLSQPWHGLVWCNPPYSAAGRWVERMAVHGNGLLLVPFVAGSWWLDALWLTDSTVVLMPAHLKFVRAFGRDQEISMRCGLWAFGAEAQDRLPQVGFTR